MGPELDFEPDIMLTDRSSPDDDVLRNPPPLLVVEISSPSTRDIDFGTKRRAYAAGGASWYWIVDPLRHEIVVLKNIDRTFVEAQRIGESTTAAGPFPVLVDPTKLTSGR